MPGEDEDRNGDHVEVVDEDDDEDGDGNGDHVEVTTLTDPQTSPGPPAPSQTLKRSSNKAHTNAWPRRVAQLAQAFRDLKESFIKMKIKKCQNL